MNQEKGTRDWDTEEKRNGVVRWRGKNKGGAETSPLWFSTGAIQLNNSIFQGACNLSFYHKPRRTCSLFSLSAYLGFFVQGHSRINIQSVQSVFIFVQDELSDLTRPDLDRAEILLWQGHLLRGGLHVSSKDAASDANKNISGVDDSDPLLSSFKSSSSSLLVVLALCLTACSTSTSDCHWGKVQRESILYPANDQDYSGRKMHPSKLLKILGWQHVATKNCFAGMQNTHRGTRVEKMHVTKWPLTHNMISPNLTQSIFIWKSDWQQ